MKVMRRKMEKDVTYNYSPCAHSDEQIQLVVKRKQGILDILRRKIKAVCNGQTDDLPDNVLRSIYKVEKKDTPC